MNLLDLVDRRDLKVKELEKLIAKAKSEKRELTDTESTEFEDITKGIEDLNVKLSQLKQEIEDLDSKIKEIQNADATDNEVVSEGRNKINTKKMEKRFNLLNAINEIVENRQSEETLKMVAEGKRNMQAAGQSSKGQLVIPFETRAISVTAGNGKEVIATEKWSLIEPLRANLVSVAAGAQFITGLTGDVSIPRYSGSMTNWQNEVAAATDGSGTFDEIKLSPIRLTCILPISKTFLVQDSTNAESMLINDLTAAISSKLEATIFGISGSTQGTPNGLFYNYTSTVSGATTYDKIIALETAVETGNALVGKLCYIVNPSVKGSLKKTVKGSNLGFILDNGEMNGYPVFASNHVAKGLGDGTEGGILFAKMDDLIIGQFGSLDIQIDPYTLAGNGQVRLIVNAYFAIAKRHNESFAVGSLK